MFSYQNNIASTHFYGISEFQFAVRPCRNNASYTMPERGLMDMTINVGETLQK